MSGRCIFVSVAKHRWSQCSDWSVWERDRGHRLQEEKARPWSKH